MSKWTSEQIEKLTAMCRQGVANKDIAAALGVGVRDVYAKRSQLGLTIEKCKATGEKGGAAGSEAAGVSEVRAVNAGGNDMAEYDSPSEQPSTPPVRYDMGKRYFIQLLGKLLHHADANIRGCEPDSDGEHVTVIFTNGHTRWVCIAGDSKLAIIADVVKAVL